MAFGRSFLYHKTAPDGQIFTNKSDYEKAVTAGWVEAPWLIECEEEETRSEPEINPDVDDKTIKPIDRMEKARQAQKAWRERKKLAT
jgi:hypothetical protein